MFRSVRIPVVYLRSMRSPTFIPLLCALASHAQSWQQLPDFPGTARDDAAAFSIGNKIYVGTGMEVGWSLTNDWWCYDTQAGSWSTIAAMPATPRQYCVAFTVNDTGYVFGGVDANGALSELWAYYPETGLWAQKASMPAEARYACAAIEAWNYGIVATGMLASGMPTKEAWKYFPATDSWEAMTPVPGPSRHRAVAIQGGGGMLIAGGADSTGTALSDAWSYPVWFETGQYYAQPDLPAPRYEMKGGSQYVMALVGGADSDTTFHADAWNGSTGNWSTLPSFPGGPRRGGVGAGIAAANNWDNTFFFGLGLDQGLTRHNDWWRLDYPVGITEQVSTRITLFPNPAQSALHITWPSEWPNAEVRIVDALGRTVEQQRVNTGSSMDVSGLAPGRYVVAVRHGAVQLHGLLTKLP
jgi:N-acetylneuraminic acid mutarotase